MRRREVLGAAAGMALGAGAGGGVPGGAAVRTQIVAGLGAAVEIAWDRWGIAHISAGSQADAFFGQGYAAAVLRLWQMDLQRRRALGRLAVAFGPDFVPYDVAARTVAFRGDVAAEWAHHDPRVKPLAQAWVAGVNARIAEVEAQPGLLAPEFVALGMRPERWGEDDLILMRDSSAPNIRAEMRRAVLAAHGALALDALATPLDPPAPLRVPEGLDCSLLHPSQLELLHRLTGPLPFPKVPLQDSNWADPDARHGSNAWVISPGRSATGRAILANDPHLGVSVPGPRVIAHLRAPGLDAIGAGPAFRPGFQFGHNARIAFGRTDFQIDQEDLLVLELNAEGTAWRGAEGWQTITRVTDRISVRGGNDVVAEIGLTSVGPIVFENRAERFALAVRSALRESGPSVALEYVPMLLAGNWAEYRQAIRTAVWGSNYMYADVDGNIGWQTGGRAPRRVGYDGLMPVPAASGARWDGFLSIDEMVGEYNPKRGWIATANQMPFPEGWPEDRVTSREWIPDDRYRRIAEVLEGAGPVSLDDCWALQHDTLSRRAVALRPVLAALTGEAADSLRSWNNRVDADSEAAALFELWSAEMAIAVRDAMVPAALREAIPVVHPHVVLGLVLGEDKRLADRMGLAQAALDRAAALLAVRPAGRRRWGDLHRLELRHTLSALVPGADVSAGGSGGDGATVMARWWAGLHATQVSGGASFAAVIDLGRWEAARGINLPGQSGDPRSRHYGDLAPLWIEGRSISLAVEGIEASEVVRLVPG